MRCIMKEYITQRSLSSTSFMVTAFTPALWVLACGSHGPVLAAKGGASTVMSDCVAGLTCFDGTRSSTCYSDANRLRLRRRMLPGRVLFEYRLRLLPCRGGRCRGRRRQLFGTQPGQGRRWAKGSLS